MKNKDVFKKFQDKADKRKDEKREREKRPSNIQPKSWLPLQLMKYKQ